MDRFLYDNGLRHERVKYRANSSWNSHFLCSAGASGLNIVFIETRIFDAEKSKQ